MTLTMEALRRTVSKGKQSRLQYMTVIHHKYNVCIKNLF